MQQNTQSRRLIRRLGVLSLILTALFAVTIIVIVLVTRGHLDIYIGDERDTLHFAPQNDRVTVEPAPYDENYLRINAKKRGDAVIEYSENEGGFEYVKVLPGGVVYDALRGGFSGYKQVTLTITVYTALMAVIFIVSFILRCRHELFSYTTLYFGGTALFLSFVSVMLIFDCIKILTNSKDFFMISIYFSIKSAGSMFMLYSMPLMIVFALALAVSNISLIGHEGKKFVNLLGLILSLLILGGYAFYFFLDRLFFMGSEWQMRIYGTIESVYTTTFVYGEAMLLSSVLCGLIAAKKRPSYNKTHILILGCSVGDDGKPMPLLQGRIDRALEFAAEQKEHGGRQIKFVPSGGQGSDEVISEAESMKRYLISKGVDEAYILPEGRSTNTVENMRFSYELIKADCESPRIAFSTSNYHVLRSGMISSAEGLDAEGIGARTKWYFWPNAFIREFVGLLVSKRSRHIFWALFLTAVFALMNMLIPM